MAEFRLVESLRIIRVRSIPGLGTGRYSEPLDVTTTNSTITAIESTRGVDDGGFNADGTNLMPGLQDSHTHFSLAALIGQCTRFSHKATKSEILVTIENHLRHRPLRLAGYDFRSATWPIPPTAVNPDAITTAPVVLMSRDLHNPRCNTPAFGQAGVTGRPTGFLAEEEAFVGIRRIMLRYLDLVEYVMQVVELEAASRGLVGIADFPSGRAVEAWQQRAASRSIGLRVETATYPERLDDLIVTGAGAGGELAENLRVGPLKIIADDSMGSCTAHCIMSYPNFLPGYSSGKSNHIRSGLLVLLGRAREAQFQTAVHAIGDAACRDAPDASETSGMRGSVERVQCIAPADLPRLARLKLVASIQPAHQLEDIGVVERVWPGAKDHIYSMLDLLHAGARLVFGFDVLAASLDPRKVIEAACHRPYRADQALVPLAVLRASTRIMLSVGQPADLVLTVGPGEVLLTMLGDRVTSSR